jgi:hypothetical protein
MTSYAISHPLSYALAFPLAKPDGGGISLNLSNATVLDSASIGDVIGALSVSGGVGSYTFTFTSNPGSLFSITGSSLKVAAALTAGSDAITIKADNGAGSVVTRAFLITVTSAAGFSPSLDFSDSNGTNAFYFFMGTF